MKFTLPQKLIISFFAVVMVILIVISCKKIDSPPQEKSKDTIAEKFFFIKPDTDPKVAAIAASIKRQNNQRKFIEKLTKNAGFAIWEKAKVISANVNTRSTSEGDCQVFIPFVPENGVQTKALLIVKLSGTDTLYHLMYGTNYKNYGFDRNTTGVWTGREVFSAFAIFDNEIFGHKEFSVKDDRLLGSDVNITNNEPIIAYMKDSVTEQSRIQTVHTFIHTVT